jgi:hypothetical protein
MANGPKKAAAATEAAPVPFSTLIDRAQAPSAASLSQRVQDLGLKLGRSAEVAGAINAAGVSGPLQLQIEASGAVAVREPGGGLTPVALSEEMRGVAVELYRSKQAMSGSGVPGHAAGSVTVSLG